MINLIQSLNEGPKIQGECSMLIDMPTYSSFNKLFSFGNPPLVFVSLRK